MATNENGIVAEVGGHELTFPFKFKTGHRLSANEAAHLNNLYLSRFGSNIRSDVERREKSYTGDELLTKWTTYELGAPREGTGTTVREEAALQLAAEFAKAQGKSLPRAKPKSTDEEKEKVAAAKAAIIARILASEKAETVARLNAIIEAIKAKRAAAAANKLPTASVDELDV